MLVRAPANATDAAVAADIAWVDCTIIVMNSDIFNNTTSAMVGRRRKGIRFVMVMIFYEGVESL